MPTELGPRELTDALTSVRHSFAGSALVATVDAGLAAIHANGAIVRADSPLTRVVRDVVAAYSECLTPAAIEHLREIPVFCHDLPLCNAVARRASGREPFVLIYSGLLAVAKYRQSVAILVSNLLHMLEQKSADLPRAQRALGDLGGLAQMLSYWFYVTPLRLPEFEGTFCDPHKTQLMHGLGCAIVFVAMHEIGHIVLGHLDGPHGPPAQIATNYVDEDIDGWKTMELAADAFAISCIRPALRLSFLTSVYIVLDLISDIECFCLPRRGTHPYVVNRVHNLAQALELGNDPFYARTTQSILAQKKALIAERNKVFSPADDRDEKAASALDAFKRSLAAPEECLRALEALLSMYDSIDYLGPHTEAEYAALVGDAK